MTMSEQILDKYKDSFHGATEVQYKNRDETKFWRVFFVNRALRSTDLPKTGFDNTTGLRQERIVRRCFNIITGVALPLV